MLKISQGVYEEHQHFRQWWIWVILVVIELLCITALVLQIGLGRPVGESPAPNWILILYALLVLALLLMFYLLRLDLIIDRTGIRYRWKPFQTKGQHIPWRKVKSAKVRKYKPLLEYGGWGIRFGLARKGMAHNVSGNMGLQLVLEKGKRILLGTQHPRQLEAFLESREYSIER